MKSWSKFLKFLTKSFSCFFGGVESTKECFYPIDTDIGVKFLPITVGPLGQSPGGVITLTVSGIVRDILTMGADSQIGQSIISWIAIDVIDYHPFRNIDPIQRENNSVDARIIFIVQDGKSKLSLSGSLGGRLIVGVPTQFSGESSVPNGISYVPKKMGPRSYFPSQLSSLFIVIKTFAKNLNRWKNSWSIHIGNLNLDVRRIWRVVSPDAPSLYTIMEINTN